MKERKEGDPERRGEKHEENERREPRSHEDVERDALSTFLMSAISSSGVSL